MIDIDRLQEHADVLIGEFCAEYCIHAVAANRSRRQYLKKLDSMETECDKCSMGALMNLIYNEED